MSGKSNYRADLRPIIIAMYQDGKSQDSIAQNLRTSKQTVRAALVGVDKQRACRFCGKIFTVPKSAKGANYYCSAECRETAQKEHKATYRSKKQESPIKSTLDATVRAADAAGMSYGKYVAAMRREAAHIIPEK